MWIWYALSVSFIWGLGYALLGIVGQKLSPFTINIVDAFLRLCVNLLAATFFNTLDNFALLEQWDIWLPLFGYIVLFIVASWINLAGYRLVPNNTAAFVAVSSTYPIFTFLVSYVLFNKRNVNVFMCSLGILFSVLTSICLALA